MCRSKIISVLFPLRYPINCATLIYGGIDTKRCMWSLQASASMISTPFCSHSLRVISPMSFLNFPYISSILWCEHYMILIPICWVWKCFDFVISVLFYHVFNLLYFSNAAAKPFLLYSEVIFYQHSRLAFSSAILFLLKLSVSPPGRNGGCQPLPYFLFYISEEDFSVLENIKIIGLPIPKRLKDILECLKDNDKYYS